MKIAHVLWNLGTGGIQTMLVDIVNIQCRSNSVAIFVVDDCIHESITNKIDSNVSIYRCNRPLNKKSIWAVVKMNFFLWKYKPDVIHVHMAGMAKLLLFPCIKVRTYHSTGLPTNEHSKYDKNFAISESVRQEIASKGLNIVKIENGIDCESFCCKKQKLCLDGIVHAVQVSRLEHRQKGQDLVLESLNIIKQELGLEFLKARFLMHFVGDGPSFDFLKTKVAEYSLEEIVSFEGYKSAQWIKNHLCDYDLFIQPSRFEGFGLTVAEAMAAKVPVIVSDNEGPMEIIDGGKYGCYFENENARSLAVLLKHFIFEGADGEKVEKAFRHVRRFYDVKRTAQQYLNEYMSVKKGEMK